MNERGPSDALAIISWALMRLDSRRHVSPARLELSHDGDVWIAQIMADPIHVPVTGSGGSAPEALSALTEAIAKLDWRRVKR